MKSPLWLGIDIGTQSVKAVLLDNAGSLVASAAEPLVSIRNGGLHEQSPEQWWQATSKVISQVVSQQPKNTEIQALSVSATSGTIVVIDSEGNALTEGIMYDDNRGAEYAAECNEAGSEIWMRLGFKIQGSWALSKIVWLNRNNQLPNGSLVINQGDYVLMRLAGRVLNSDSSNSLKSGFDIEKLEWPSEVFKKLNVEISHLPEVSVAGEIIGSLSLTSTTGLPQGCKIVAGMTDGCAAQISAGALTPGSWNSVLGTTLVIKGMSNERHNDENGSVYAHLAPFKSGWWPGGASSTGTNAFLAFLPETDPSTLNLNDEKIINSPIFYPVAGRGERFPFVNSAAFAISDARESSTWLTDGDQELIFAAIAKGIAFLERLSYDLLALVGYDITGSITLTGGGAKNEQWNQLRADVLGRSLLVPDSKEGAVGMAVLASAAFENCLDEKSKLLQAATRMIESGIERKPRSAFSNELIRQYPRFVEMLFRENWISESLHDFAIARART